MRPCFSLCNMRIRNLSTMIKQCNWYRTLSPDVSRDEKRRGGSAEGPMISPLGSGTIPTWEHASPELTSILENLKRTEQHLQGKETQCTLHLGLHLKRSIDSD